jgi:hypothetical protein
MGKVFKSELRVGNTHRLIFEFFSSWLLCLVLILLLMLLVFLGTLAQTELGIYEAQKLFFDSVFFLYPLGNIQFPLPGAYLLLSLLFINVVCGGIIRLKFSRRNFGIIVTHAGVLFLLLSGMVSFHFSSSGFIRLQEGDMQDYFESWTEWDVLITAYKNEEEPKSLRIPLNQSVKSKEYSVSGINLTVKEIYKNSEIVQSAGRDSVEGVAIKVKKEEKDTARNVPSARAVINGNDVLISGWQFMPYILRKDGEEVQFHLVRKRFRLPYDITLNKFSMEMHPNTDSPSLFKSSVKVDGTTEHLIEMNEPLRKDGIAVFQSSWEKRNSDGKTVYFSTFSVVQNPADQWPLYACIVLAAGLLIHFSPMLLNFLKEEEKQ